jgi:hypothetical protein
VAFNDYAYYEEVARLARLRLLRSAIAPPSPKALASARARAKYSQSSLADQARLRADVDCEQECLNGTAYCNRGIPDDQEKLKETKGFLDTIPTQDGIISNSALLAIFGVTVDACDRGDSLSRNGRFINRGQACVYPIVADGQSGQSTLPPVALLLTDVSKPRVVRNGATTSLIFAGDGMMPNIVYRRISMDEFYGGRVSQIRSTANGLFYRTQNGTCTSMELKQ